MNIISGSIHFLRTNKDVTFLKIDVDGAESVVLGSCDKSLKLRNLLKWLFAPIIRNDEKDFTALLKDHGFAVSPSKGYMINYYDKKLKAPYLRRGLIRAVR